jgi:hypothetical protein
MRSMEEQVLHERLRLTASEKGADCGFARYDVQQTRCTVLKCHFLVGNMHKLETELHRKPA